MRLAALFVLAALPVLAGGKHYSVCFQSEAGVGCTTRQFTLKDALVIQDIIASLPIDATYQVGVRDNKPKKSKSAIPAPAVPTPAPPTPQAEPTTPSNPTSQQI